MDLDAACLVKCLQTAGYVVAAERLVLCLGWELWPYRWGEVLRALGNVCTGGLCWKPDDAFAVPPEKNRPFDTADYDDRYYLMPEPPPDVLDARIPTASEMGTKTAVKIMDQFAAAPFHVDGYASKITSIVGEYKDSLRMVKLGDDWRFRYARVITAVKAALKKCFVASGVVLGTEVCTCAKECLR